MNIKNIRLWFNVQTHKIRSTCGVSHHFSYANPKNIFVQYLQFQSIWICFCFLMDNDNNNNNNENFYFFLDTLN